MVCQVVLVAVWAPFARAQVPAAAEPPAPAPAVAKELVCVAVPLSGPHRAIGEAAAARVEAGLRDDLAVVAVRRYDTRGTAPDAAAAVVRGAEEGCVLVVGGLGDREALAAADAAESSGLPMIALGEEPDGRERARVVWPRVSRADRIRVLARHMATQGVADVVAIFPESPYARRALEDLRPAAEAAGLRVVAVKAYPAGSDLGKVAADLVADLGRVPDRPACPRDAVFVPADLAAARRLLPFLEFAGIAGKRSDPKCGAAIVAGTELWNDPKTLARTGDSLERAVFADVPGASLEAEAEDAGALAGAAVRAAAGGGRDAVTRVLRGEVAWTGRSGDLRLSAGRAAGRDPVVLVVRRGVAVPPEPDGGLPPGSGAQP